LKKILLTYDYELFLGSDSGDLYNTLINPTEKILEMLNKYQAKGLFFIDATFLLTIRNLECFDKVKKQIQSMVISGHDIGLHIHSHWLDAKLVDNCRWQFNEYRYFRLHNLEDKDLEKLIKDCYKILSIIVYEVKKDYNIETFRAGGWSIQPFKKLNCIFRDIGIRYDFSVLPDMVNDDRPKHYYDFRNFPNKDIWQFNDDISKEDNNGYFTAISNTVFNMNIFDLIKNKKIIKNYKIVGDGRGAGKKKSFFEQLKRVRWNVKQILSSDGIDINIFIKYISTLDKRIFVYVSHPKLFSDNSFEVLEYICKNFYCINYNKLVKV